MINPAVNEKEQKYLPAIFSEICERIQHRADWAGNYWLNYTADRGHTAIYVTLDYQRGRHVANSIQLCDIDCSSTPALIRAIELGYHTAVKNIRQSLDIRS